MAKMTARVTVDIELDGDFAQDYLRRGSETGVAIVLADIVKEILNGSRDMWELKATVTHHHGTVKQRKE